MPWRVLTRFRFLLQVAMDSVAWCAALLLATVLRDEFRWVVPFFDILLVGIVASVLQLLAGTRFGLYIHRWRYGAFEEVGGLARTVAVVTVAVAVLNRFVLGHRVPVSASLMAGPLAFLLMAGARFGWRNLIERLDRPDGVGAKRVIVFGAGEGGSQVIRAMTSKSSPYYPVAILDDDPRYRNLQIKGVRVRGDRSALARVAGEVDARMLLIAIPSATGDLLRELSELAREAGLKVMVLPPVAELFGAGVGVADIRPITEEDILGRRALDTDIDAVAGYLSGKRVLVTGAGGSIGSELCRQIHRFAPKQLVMLDRDESGLQSVQLSIEGQGLLDRDELVVADIRDAERMDEVFAGFRPEVVFHAAALKHLTLLERNPAEGFKTNVEGTQHLLDVSGRYGVSVFVNISTDKAADAESVLGRTKRMAEQLTAQASRLYDGRYLSVRFGNVLGSRGSVLPLFRTQIERGGPVTVTHPEVTRYFMTIPEASELVIQAGAIGDDGHVMVLDMGEPVCIDEVARRLIAESGKRIEIVYTGLRQGEKLHEVLFGDHEDPRPSAHPLISCVDVQPMELVAAARYEISGEHPVIDITSAAGGASGATKSAAEGPAPEHEVASVLAAGY